MPQYTREFFGALGVKLIPFSYVVDNAPTPLLKIQDQVEKPRLAHLFTWYQMQTEQGMPPPVIASYLVLPR